MNERPSARNVQERMAHSSEKMIHNQQSKPSALERSGHSEKPRKKNLGRAVFRKPVVREQKGGGGRPPQLDLTFAERICHHIAAGHFVQSALAAEGVARRTYYFWMERGEQDLVAEKDSVYVEFLHMIKKAEFMAEDQNLKILLAGGIGWQANAWFLERRFPAKWGNRFKFTIEEAQDFMRKFLNIVAQHIPDRELVRKIVNEATKIEGKGFEGAGSKQ